MEMQLKRFIYFLLINVFVSIITTLIVLMVWDRAHQTESLISEPVADLPELVFPTQTPKAIPDPTPALQTYQVSTGETLSEIALAFDVSVDQLLEINGFDNPDAIGTGTVIFVPRDDASSTNGESEAISEEQMSLDEIILPDNVKVEIAVIVGAGDLASERVQLRGIGEGSLSLAGWKLRDEDQNEYSFPAITLFEDGAVNVFSSVGVDTVVALYWGLSSAVWESGEIATLIDNLGSVQAIYQVP
jgi:LysM repeat protein